MKIRLAYLLPTLGFACLLLGGCSEDEGKHSDLPWVRPANWEAPLGGGQ